MSDFAKGDRVRAYDLFEGEVVGKKNNGWIGVRLEGTDKESSMICYFHQKDLTNLNE